MIIIIDGNIKLRKFVCRDCDTVFIAHQEDYVMTVFEKQGFVKDVPHQDILGATTLGTIYREPTVECPVCKRFIKVKYGEKIKL